MSYFKIYYPHGMQSRYRSPINAAVTFWNKAVSAKDNVDPLKLTGSLDISACGVNYIYSSGQIINGLDIFAFSEALDGQSSILASAGPCGFVNEEPRISALRFDSADLQPLLVSGQLIQVAKHEIAHAMGFGTLWLNYDLIRRPENKWTRYTGSEGKKLWKRKGGTGNIPIGQNHGHWREVFFGNELMTPTINEGDNPLSSITIASIRDMGYKAYIREADSYSLPERKEGGSEYEEGEVNYGDDLLNIEHFDIDEAIIAQQENKRFNTEVVLIAVFFGMLTLIAVAAAVLKRKRILYTS
eukprot:snap_masked-scaffold_22-processed-gene-1.31-mRNA-1 protein AED:1.00 eAED:1.00 QI:0/-1/0/0/-1/1/1/0/298